MNDIRMVFFDMEGTLLEKAVTLDAVQTYRSAWAALGQQLGTAAYEEEKATQQKWDNGAYGGNYVLWMEETVAIHRKYGLDKNLFYKVMNAFRYHAGVEDVCRGLRARGIVTVLVTGGFKIQADKAMQDLNLTHSFAACEYFWDEYDRLHHWNLLPADAEGKKGLALLMMKEYGFRPAQCAFVGDSDNDIPLARSVGVSIAFNATEGLREACTHKVDQSPDQIDFRAVKEFI